jgi:hypothetical protein
MLVTLMHPPDLLLLLLLPLLLMLNHVQWRLGNCMCPLQSSPESGLGARRVGPFTLEPVRARRCGPG